MAEKQKHPSESEKENEHWMNSKWRPMMGWMYMAVCTCDFMLFPILWSVLQSISHGSVNTQWQPITLQGAGLFHIAMGAVLGIAAYGRTQEKLGGANNGGISLPPNAGTTYTPPATVQPPAAPGSFGASSTAYTPAPGWGTTPITAPASAEIITGFGGKPAPVIPPFPER